MDRFDAIGPHAYGEVPLSCGLHALVIFKITQCGSSQSSRTDLIFKLRDHGRFR